MTDKQILIDGVDIKECAYFRYPLGCNSLDNKTCQCMNNDCDYKELKRKEQECERLEEENETLQKEKENYCFDCDVAERMRKVTYAATGGRLSYANYTVEAIEQAYNDQLRIDVEYRTKELEDELNQLKETNESLLSIQYKLADSNTKLRQALKEIKNIVETCISGIDCSECPYAERCRTDIVAEALGVCKLILEKCEG